MTTESPDTTLNKQFIRTTGAVPGMSSTMPEVEVMTAKAHERVILTHQTENTHDFTVELFLDYGTEEGEWVGVCEQLGIAANADTLDETKEILKDLILLQLNGIEGLTSIYAYLSEHGVTILEPENPGDDESGFILTTATSGL